MTSPRDQDEKRRMIVIGITADVDPTGRIIVARTYCDAVVRAGAVPIIIPPCLECLDSCLELCHGFVFTGGDDPDMTMFGQSTHPGATLMHPVRQEFEVTLLRRLEQFRSDSSPSKKGKPALGICLGMQLMSLVRGGRLNQYLPDSLPTHALHWGKRMHSVSGVLGSGLVQSHHRQAIDQPGNLEVVARSEDGLIEAVRDPSQAFYVGVQWHPERSEGSYDLGQGLFMQLIETCNNNH